MLDIQRSRFSERFEKTILTGAAITEEGQALIMVDDGAGNAVVQPSAGNVGEVFYGFAITDDARKGWDVAVENMTIPAVAPYTLQLANGNLTGIAPNVNCRVYNKTSAAYLTQVAGAPAATEFSVSAAGLVTFNVAEAADEVEISYQFELTQDQIFAKYHQQPVSFAAQALLSTVGVGGGYGVAFVTNYLVLSSTGGGAGWMTVAAGVPVFLGAGGALALAGNVEIGKLVKRPTEDDPWIGVEFNANI